MQPLTYQIPFAALGHAGRLELIDRQLPTHNVLNKSGKKILVVDDDQILCLGLKVRLNANFYNLCFAHDGESAISVARSEKPDLIILDLGLPRGDGYFVMKSLNAAPSTAAVPIIVLTARDSFTHGRRCSEAGAKQFLEKPVSSLRLLTAIQQFVQ